MSVHAPTGDPAHPWEPFLNRTHNGIYWACRRWRPAATSNRLGWEIMMTRDLRPRRFGSQIAAGRVADAANRNGGVPPEKPLSAAAREYLAGYGLDYLHSNPRMSRAGKASFASAFVKVEFDDPAVLSADLRLAKALRARGYFKRFRMGDSRRNRVAYKLQVEFSQAGAEAVYDALLATGRVTHASEHPTP